MFVRFKSARKREVVMRRGGGEEGRGGGEDGDLDDEGWGVSGGEA